MLYLQDRVNALEMVSRGVFFLLLSELLLVLRWISEHSPKEAVRETISKTTSRVQREDKLNYT